jgi:hypothetical protein
MNFSRKHSNNNFRPLTWIERSDLQVSFLRSVGTLERNLHEDKGSRSPRTNCFRWCNNPEIVINILSKVFDVVLIRHVSQIKITLLLKIQWKQHHILYIKIVYNIV